jgi:hypothetical protein
VQDIVLLDLIFQTAELHFMQRTESTGEKKAIGRQQLNQVRKHFQKLQETYVSILPKVDLALLNDFLNREGKSDRPLSYTIEVFTKPGLDTEVAREYIISKTGMAPAIFDNGTHYVTNQILTLEMLKEINDSDDVVEIRGSYCGGIGMRAAYFERAPH